MPKITCPLWAPLILEEAVECTAWGTNDRRGTFWDGKVGKYSVSWKELVSNFRVIYIEMTCMPRTKYSSLIFSTLCKESESSVLWMMSMVTWFARTGL